MDNTVYFIVLSAGWYIFLTDYQSSLHQSLSLVLLLKCADNWNLQASSMEQPIHDSQALCPGLTC